MLGVIAFMTKATPEQIRVFRHRRMLVMLGCGVVFILGFLLGMILLGLSAHHKYDVPMILSASPLIFIWLGILVLKSAFFRCPICGHPIPNQGGGPGRPGTFGTRCDKCDVSFQGEAFAANGRRAFWLFVVAISLLILIGGFWLLMVIL